MQSRCQAAEPLAREFLQADAFLEGHGVLLFGNMRLRRICRPDFLIRPKIMDGLGNPSHDETPENAFASPQG
jgi:hypothetical protein